MSSCVGETTAIIMARTPVVPGCVRVQFWRFFLSELLETSRSTGMSSSSDRLDHPTEVGTVEGDALSASGEELAATAKERTRTAARMEGREGGGVQASQDVEYASVSCYVVSDNVVSGKPDAVPVTLCCYSDTSGESHACDSRVIQVRNTN